MKDILSFFGLQILLPAVVISGAIGFFLKWADKYAPQARHQAQEWLTNPHRRSFDLGSTFIELGRLLYGKTFSVRRVLFLLISIGAGLALALTLSPPPTGRFPIYVSEVVFLAADFLKYVALRDPLAAALARLSHPR
jgi:hypothetical protein